jgi:hypothetical protein
MFLRVAIALFFAGQVLASLSSLTNLTSDIELNVSLVKAVIDSINGLPFAGELKSLEKSISQFSDALLQPQILKRFCGNATSPNPFIAGILNKYQLETVNPFATRIDYKALDQSKFMNPIPEGFSASSLKDLPLLDEEFRQLIKNDNVSIFKQKFDVHTDIVQYRYYMKKALQKFVFGRLEEFGKAIEPGKGVTHIRVNYCSIEKYINYGKPKPKYQRL